MKQVCSVQRATRAVKPSLRSSAGSAPQPFSDDMPPGEEHRATTTGAVEGIAFTESMMGLEMDHGDDGSGWREEASVVAGADADADADADVGISARVGGGDTLTGSANKEHNTRSPIKEILETCPTTHVTPDAPDLSPTKSTTTKSTATSSLFSLGLSPSTPPKITTNQPSPETGLLTPPPTPTHTSPSPWPESTPAAPDAFIIRPSATGGMGAFAARALHKDEVILEEAPLLIADKGSLFRRFAGLGRREQRRAIRMFASGHFKTGPRLAAVWDTNSFATGINREAGLFPIAARFNHACAPRDNIHFEYDRTIGKLRFWVGADGIAEGEELKICYGVSKTPAQLYAWYGFRCACGACEGLTEEEMERFTVKW